METSAGTSVLTPSLPTFPKVSLAFGRAATTIFSSSPIDDLKKRMVPLSLEHKSLIERYLAAFPGNVCEMTFASLYYWGKVFPHYLGKISPHFFCEYEGHVLIGFYNAQKRFTLYQPIGPEPERIVMTINQMQSPIEWTCVDETIAKNVSDDSSVMFDRDNSDYVYDLCAIRALKGKKYHRKRTYIQHCLEYQPTVVRLDASMALSCLKVNQKWLSAKENPHSTDADALEHALTAFDALKLSGVGVLINNTLEGFAIGEPLNGTTFVSHFLKANYDFLGLFQFVAHEFAKAIPESFTHLNKEQDLGIEGLRIAKEGWCPVSLVKKFTIRNKACCA